MAQFQPMLTVIGELKTDTLITHLADKGLKAAGKQPVLLIPDPEAAFGKRFAEQPLQFGGDGLLLFGTGGTERKLLLLFGFITFARH